MATCNASQPSAFAPGKPFAPHKPSLHIVPPDIPDLKFVMWAPRARRCVFNSWTIPEYIELWASSGDCTEIKATAYLCTGAPFSITAWRRDIEQYRVAGRYILIDEPAHILCTWDTRSAGRQWYSTLRVNFEEFEEGTLLRIVQSGIELSDHRERQRQWWHDRLEHLRALLRLTPAATS
jgi:uncharacterized protein YndB with AHSA1/START domain